MEQGPLAVGVGVGLGHDARVGSPLPMRAGQSGQAARSQPILLLSTASHSFQ